MDFSLVEKSESQQMGDISLIEKSNVVDKHENTSFIDQMSFD